MEKIEQQDDLALWDEEVEEYVSEDGYPSAIRVLLQYLFTSVVAAFGLVVFMILAIVVVGVFVAAGLIAGAYTALVW